MRLARARCHIGIVGIIGIRSSLLCLPFFASARIGALAGLGSRVSIGIAVVLVLVTSSCG